MQENCQWLLPCVSHGTIPLLSPPLIWTTACPFFSRLRRLGSSIFVPTRPIKQSQVRGDLEHLCRVERLDWREGRDCHVLVIAMLKMLAVWLEGDFRASVSVISALHAVFVLLLRHNFGPEILVLQSEFYGRQESKLYPRLLSRKDTHDQDSFINMQVYTVAFSLHSSPFAIHTVLCFLSRQSAPWMYTRTTYCVKGGPVNFE